MRSVRFAVALSLIAPLFATLAIPTSVAAVEDCTFFPETGYRLCGGFRSYWEAFGGLAIFGYPLTGEFVDPATGRVTQWFERARFEWHPGAFPERYDVLLGLLGRELTRKRGNAAPFRPAQPIAGCTYFPETRHNLCGGFRAHWETFGGLAIYGYPISEEFTEVNPDTGQRYVVQYFERQRFEWHLGEWPERYDVMLGRLGAQLLDEQPTPPPTSRQPIMDDVRLAEFCSKAVSMQYTAGALTDPLQLRTWVLEALADSDEIVSRWTVDRYTERVAQVNPYLAYSLFYVYRDGVPSDAEVLAWFPLFVQAFVDPDGPQTPADLRLPYMNLREVASFLSARLTRRSDPSSEFLYRACLRVVNALGQVRMFNGLIMIAGSNTMGLFEIQVLSLDLETAYEHYIMQLSDGHIPRTMSFIEYLTTYEVESFAYWFPDVDWERIREEWAAERLSAAP